MTPLAKETKLTIRWDIGILNKIIGVVYKKNINITIANLRNIQILFNKCDLSIVQNKNTIMKRIQFIRKSLEAKLDNKFEDEALIINYCRTDVDDPIIEDIINNLSAYKKMNHSEIQFINKYVEDRLRHGIVENYIGEMREIIDKIESGEYMTYAEAYLVISHWISGLQTEVRRVTSEYNNSMLNLNDPNITEKVQDILSRLSNSHSTIITGIQMLNEMLSPGFRAGKLYTVMGISGGFKSAMLLKIVLDCVKYNHESYKPKKEGLKPVVLYVTMENTKDESFARMFNMECVADDMEKYKSEYIVDQMQRAKIINNPDMEVIIAYRANMSIDTNDLRSMIDQLEEEGKEVVLLSFDYIKRIKDVGRAPTEKEQLKNVTNELRQIAIDYFIPVVTAHQINRAGVATINAAAREKKADLAQFVGQENIGSAWEVQENSDFVLLLNIERRKDGRLFLTFKRFKTRYRPHTKLDYFNQPFSPDNDFKLMDDILLDKPLGVISLSTDLEGVEVEDIISKRGRRVVSSDNTPVDNQNLGVMMNLFNLKPANK